MKTRLSPEFAATPDGLESADILRKCVHCGFCTATCPTYQLLGDELDGPRGRIYLMKQALEGGKVTRRTQLHLDRCLTCRSCETTCPSGVQYGNLLNIGRRVVDQRVARPVGEKALRWLLRESLTSPLFAAAVRLGQRLRPLPAAATRPPLRTTGPHARQVLLLAGCVQPALRPDINAATARVLDAAGMATLIAGTAGCCGVTVKEYGHALAHDAEYAAKAQRISALTRDLSELLPELTLALRGRIAPPPGQALAYHPPCTLQHGQQLGSVLTCVQKHCQ